jgi:hypothetical protein
MRSIARSATLAVMAGALACAGATSASAKCQRLGFLVNDYGKDGPTKDAMNLLDKYVVDWTKEKGIKKYTVGKKDVSCELFLNLLVVDEHTCKARVTVCWGDEAVAPGTATPAAAPPVKAPTPAKKPKSAGTTG